VGISHQRFTFVTVNSEEHILLMALRRRIGISTATTEAARRQLMQPVPCWEKVWVVPEKAASGSTIKVLKWVKTNKTQVRLARTS